MFNAATIIADANMRVTRPRLKLVSLLFADGENRHITADWIHERLTDAGEDVALATIYNSLSRFVEVGLLKEVSSSRSGPTIFDTNTEPHYHFMDEATGELTDIPADQLELGPLPEPANGQKIIGCEIIVRTR